MTWKRLFDTLEKAGDKQAARKYNGEYLREYEWAEERNAQLYRMLTQEEKESL